MHPEKENNDFSYFQALRDKLKQKKSIVSLMTKQEQKAAFLPVIEEVLRGVVRHSSPHIIIKFIPLSDDTLRRRVDEIVVHIEESLCDILKKQRFGLHLDKSTLPVNESLLLGYSRCIKNNKGMQELLFAKELETDTRGVSVFKGAKQFFKENSLFDTVMQFLEEKKCSDLSDGLLACKTDIAYLTDLFCKFNDLNLPLQGDYISLIKAKSKIFTFIEKLLFFRENIDR
ncbi:protein FAM200C-like [Lepeophtheirus salmonis]|uniref:protein FAM200C-like n=1 Tax=Lepeophtheirus salmonis TaxID=72036 RepID=UPI003AF34F82